ncbi:unnamed protein product, partial [Callosobruchus maculatus]
RRRICVNRLWRAREGEEELHTTFARLKDDPEQFVRYFRMNFLKFDNLLKLVNPHIQKQNLFYAGLGLFYSTSGAKSTYFYTLRTLSSIYLQFLSKYCLSIDYYRINIHTLAHR